MRKEMVIKIHASSEHGYSKAMKTAAAFTGVESVTIAGEERNLLLVIGDVRIDSDRITKKLKRKVGHAEVVELRTVDPVVEELASVDHAYYRYHPSPPGMYYQLGARDDHRYYNGGGYLPGQYHQQQQQQAYSSYPSTVNMRTVVHQGYATDDPNIRSIL